VQRPLGPEFSNFRWPEATENSKIPGRARLEKEKEKEKEKDS